MEKRKNEPKTKQCTITELMLSVSEPYRRVYYHKDTGIFDDFPISSIELETLSPDAKITDINENDFPLPDYDEINHKELMRFFVRECVYDTEMRKQLFYILRRDNYIDAYIDALKKFELYDEFDMVCGDIYREMFWAWAEENELDFSHGR